MKNLKKVLALVLVIASLMGLATMASATTSEDYSDADSITHIEAVDVMSTIGVFDGISGAFSGDSILTREQAAKIITYMILGKDDADALVASVAPYTDVSRDRWSAGSIAYCKNAGILAGVGNGRFEPDGKLTGVAFAKMCLVALGYDPEVEKLTGSQWAVNTSTIAIAGAGITDNLSQVSLADEMSREDACQMAFNTLKADMVDYDNRGTIITAGDVVVNTTPSKAKPVSKETGWKDAERAGIDGNIGGEADGIQQFAEKYFTKLTEKGGKDSFGRPSTTWKYKADEIGTYVKNSQLIKSWTTKVSKDEMYNAIGGSIVKGLEVGDKGSYDLQVYVDSSAYRVKSDIEVKDIFAKNSTAAAGKKLNSNLYDGSNIGVSGNGVLTELYMDDDDNVSVVMINTYLVQATADYNTVNERVSIEAKPIDEGKKVPTNFLPTYISNDDFDVSNIKEGDYLLVTVSFGEAQWGTNNKCSLESVTPATIQKATVTEYTEKSDVTMGGTKYSYNKILGDDEKGAEFAINSEATLVLDTYGYIMYVDEAISSNSFVYIDNFAGTSGLNSNVVADAYFTDGTTAEISVKRVDAETSKPTISTYNSKEDDSHLNSYEQSAHKYTHWYTYSGTSGGQYTLNTPNSNRYAVPQTVLVDGTKTGSIIKNGTVRFMSDITGLTDYMIKDDAIVTSLTGVFTYSEIRANDKTIFIVKDNDGDVASYTGIANVPDVKTTDGFIGHAKVSWICKKDSKYASYVFVDVSGTKASVEDVAHETEYMFTLKSTGNRTHVEGMTYYKYKVVIDGKEEERWISNDLVGSGKTTDDEGKLFSNIKVDSNGRITGATEIGKKSRQASVDMTLNKDYTIEADAGTLDIAALAESDNVGRNLLSNSKSNMNLVIGSNSNSSDLHKETLLYDEGADYETHLGVTAQSIGNMLKGYDLSGRVYVVVDDEDSDLIDTLWIYVDNIKKTASQS